MDNLRSFKSLIDRSLSFGDPTPKQLERINSRLSSPVKPEDVFVFPSYASNRNIDSFHSIMDDTSLRNYAEDYDKGAPFLRQHDATDFALGRTFEGIYIPNEGKTLVYTYVTRGLKLNSQVASDDFIRGIETGVVQDVSIRFKGGWDRCNMCNERLYSKACRHIPGEEYDGKIATYQVINARARELSAVTLGSTPEAGVIRKIRMLWNAKQIDENMVSSLSRKLAYNVRTAIEGEEYLKFAFETDADDDTDDMIDADQGQNVDGSPLHDDKVNPVTGAVTEGPGKGASTFKEGRNFVYTEDEIKGFTAYYSRALVEHGHEMPSEMKTEIREFLESLERKDKVIEPPSLKANTHTHSHSHGSETHEHEHQHHYGPMDDHSHGHTAPKAEGMYAEQPADEAQLRHLKPIENMSFVQYMRARIEDRAALKSATNPMEAGNPGTLNGGAKDIPQLNGGIPDPGSDPGHAGLIMPGQDPIQDVAWKGFSVADGEPIGDTASDKITQNTSMSIPGLEITPEGIVKWIMGTQSSVMGEAGIDGLIARSEPDKLEGKYVPMRTSFGDPEMVRELLSMASDGALFRGQLLDNLMRYGCLVEGDKFDKEFHARIANKLNTSELSRMVDNFAIRVNEKFKTNPTETIRPSEFPDVTRRQTTGPVKPAKEEVVPTGQKYDLSRRAELYSDN